MLDPERLGDLPGERLAEPGFRRRAVGQAVITHSAGVIEECERGDDAELGIDRDEAPIADAGDEAEETRFELLLHPQCLELGLVGRGGVARQPGLQRIGLARSLALNPDFIVCDEPVSALDVSIQAQIINLLENLQADFELTYLFIAHDLAVVRHISDRIAVMYLGKIVEISPAAELYDEPFHPYTISLLSAVPIPDPVVERERETILLACDLPSPANPPPACRFHTRCPYVQPTRCRDEEPPLRRVASGHVVACHWAEDIRAGKIQPQETKPQLVEQVGAPAWEPPPV